MRLVPVPPAKVGKAWPHVEEWVERALERGNADHTAEGIRDQIHRGTSQLWLVWGEGQPQGVVITEILDGARGRTCNIVVLAGERFSGWEHLQADLAQWAREYWGCVRLSLVGRKGWVRRLAGAGWSETAVTLERVIGGGTV